MKNLNLLLPTPAPQTDMWTWATVTQASPLLIRLDGDEDPLTGPPEALCSGLSVGHRVWVQINGRRVIVHGRSYTA